MMCTYWPRGTFKSWPVTTAAAKRMAAPMPEPATRRLQGDISRSATAAAIQFKPQANASSTTSSLAVPGTVARACVCGMGRSGFRRSRGRARYSAGSPEARYSGHANLRFAAPSAPRVSPSCCAAVCPVLASPRFQGVSAGFRDVPKTDPGAEFPLIPTVCAADPRRRPACELAKRASPLAAEDPIVSGMAGRYATALFELALEEKAIDAVKKDLEQFDALIGANPDLARLRSPVFGADRRLKALSPPFSTRPASRGSPPISCASSPPTAGCSPRATSSAASARWSPATAARSPRRSRSPSNSTTRKSRRAQERAQIGHRRQGH